MKGKLYSVGVGPGDPELMTLKAVRLIKECDVLAIPRVTVMCWSLKTSWKELST